MSVRWIIIEFEKYKLIDIFVNRESSMEVG